MNFLKKLLLSLMFLIGFIHANTTVYENGDNIRANWKVVDGSGSISVVTDTDRGNKVIELSGTDGLADSFKISDNWNESNKHIFSWKMKYNEDFTFYVKVKTKNNGIKYVIYKPLDNYSGISNSGNIRIALGTSANIGIWKTFTRDIKADIQMYNSGYKLDKIINIIVRGSGRLDDIQIQSTLNNLKRIFILGSSTVHTANYISSNRDSHGSGRKLSGWGEYLKYYLKDSTKVYNRARSGADSVTYINPDSNRGNLPGYKDRYWGFTKNLIQSTNDNNGGFLLIQFGANDSLHHVDIDTFKNQLRYYISEARKLGLIPVLISPPNSRNHINSRPYAKYIEPIADSENVLFLDLHQKSMDIWSNYEIDDYNNYKVEDKSGYQRLPQADILYGYLEYYRYINNTHFSPTGANIVAGWIKELACQSDRNDGKLLCKQFLTDKNVSNNIPPVISLVGKAVINIDINTSYYEKGATASDDIDGDISTDIITLGNVNIHKLGTYKITYTVSDSSNHKVSTTRTVHVINPNAGAITVYEDAEDGDTAGWGLYSTTDGATITNVVEHGGHAIKLEGNNGLHNGFKYPNFTNNRDFITSWSLKYTNPFRLFVLIRSTNSPNNNIYMEYTPENTSRGLYNRVYIHNGLGTDANDGTWHTFTRDIQADFHNIYPNEKVIKIVGFAIRGSGLVDNLIIKNK